MKNELVECIRCRQVKSVAEMRKAPRLKRGYYLYCAECDNRRRTEARNRSHLPRKEIRRKLPAYAELKNLYCDHGMSYADIAERYDVHRSAVYMTMRRRAYAYGDPWPLVSWVPIVEKLKRTLSRDSVDPSIIISYVWDHLWEQAELRTAQRRQEIAQCVQANGPHGTELTCQHHRRLPFNLVLDDFCRQHGFTFSYLKDIHARREKTISAAYAARLLRAIGETPRPVKQRSAKYTGNHPSHRKRKKAGTGCTSSNALTATTPQSESTTPALDAGSQLSAAS